MDNKLLASGALTRGSVSGPGWRLCPHARYRLALRALAMVRPIWQILEIRRCWQTPFITGEKIVQHAHFMKIIIQHNDRIQ